MRILSAIPGTLPAKVFARRPLQYQNEEVVFPPKIIGLPFGVPVKVPDDARKAIMAKHGPAGLIEVRDVLTDQELAEQMLTAKRKRYDHLRHQIDSYRTEQGLRQAQGSQIMMPNNAMRALWREAKGLVQELAETDPILKEVLPKFKSDKPEPAEVADPMAQELKAFGISEKAAPILPGVTVFEETIPL